MANVLVIFDVDGFLSYVKEDRLDRAPVKSFPCFVTCGTKPLLAEVLEVSDDIHALEEFESNFLHTQKFQAVMEARRNGQRGGYLSTMNDKENHDPGVSKNRRTRTPQSSKGIKTTAKKALKKLQLTLREQVLFRRKPNKVTPSSDVTKPLRPAAEKNPSRQATDVKPPKRAAELAEGVNREPIIAAAKRPRLDAEESVTPTRSEDLPKIVKRPRMTPNQGRGKTTTQVKTRTSGLARSRMTRKARTVRNERNVNNKDVERADTQTRQAPVELKGTNNRVVKVFYEGSSAKSGSAMPRRKPMFTEGLSEDQRDVINARLIEYNNNRMSTMCQTDSVRIINNDEELKLLLGNDTMISASTSSPGLPPSGAQVSASSPGLPPSGAQVSASPGLPPLGAQVSASSPGLPPLGAQVSASSPGLPPLGAQVPASSPGLPPSGAQVSASSPGLPLLGAQVSASSPGLPPLGAQVPASSPGLPPSGVQVSASSPGLPPSGAQVSASSPGLPPLGEANVGLSQTNSHFDIPISVMDEYCNSPLQGSFNVASYIQEIESFKPASAVTQPLTGCSATEADGFSYVSSNIKRPYTEFYLRLCDKSSLKSPSGPVDLSSSSTFTPGAHIKLPSDAHAGLPPCVSTPIDFSVRPEKSVPISHTTEKLPIDFSERPAETTSGTNAVILPQAGLPSNYSSMPVDLSVRPEKSASISSAQKLPIDFSVRPAEMTYGAHDEIHQGPQADFLPYSSSSPVDLSVSQEKSASIDHVELSPGAYVRLPPTVSEAHLPSVAHAGLPTSVAHAGLPSSIAYAGLLSGAHAALSSEAHIGLPSGSDARLPSIAHTGPPSGACAGYPTSIDYVQFPSSVAQAAFTSGAHAGLSSVAHAGLPSSLAHVGLPSVAHAGLLSSVSHAGAQAGLPSGAHAGLPPSVAHAGLPSGAHAALPSSVNHVGLPSSVSHAGAHAGLPPSVANAGLPSGAHAGLPTSLAHAGLPPSVGHASFTSSAHAGLPTSIAHVGLPPSVAHAGLPSGAHAGLLSSVNHVGLPSSVSHAGAHAGLPSVANAGLPSSAHAGLPTSLAHAGLPPSVGHASFTSSAHAGLPTSIAHVGLPPSVAHAGLPSGAHAGLPTSIAHAGLPPSVAHAGLPTSVAHNGLPPSVAHAGLPLGAHAGLPTSVAHAGLPSSAHAGLPTSVVHAGLPPSVAHAGPPVAHAGLPPVAHAGLPSGAHAGLPSSVAHAELPPISHSVLPSGAHAGLPPSVAYAGLPSGADAGLPSRANAGLSSSVANVGLPSGVHAGLSTSVAHSGFVSFDTHSGLSPSNADLGLTPSVTHSQLTTDGHCGLTPSVTHSKLTSSDAHSILYSGFTHSEAHSRPGLSGAHDRISDAKTRCAPGDHAGIPHSDVNVGTLNNCSNTQLSASAHDSFLHTSVHSGLSPTHANLSASNDYPQLSPSGANDGCAALSSAGIPASSAVHGALPPSSVSSRISTFVSPDRFLQTSVDTSLPHSDAHLEIPPSGVCSKPSLGTHTNILPSDAHASFAVNSAPQPSSHHSDPSHIPTALELDSPTGSGMPSNDDEMDYHPYSTSSLPYIAEPYHSVSLSSTTPSQTRTSPAYNTPPNSSSLGQSPTSPVIEISGPDSMASVPPHCSVRISAHCISKYLADDDHVGHLAWGLIKDMYFNSELIGRTLNGTSRGEAISPRRKNAVLKAIEDQLEGSKAKDAYRRTAHQAIVSGLRNISRSRGKLPANLSLKFF